MIQPTTIEQIQSGHLGKSKDAMGNMKAAKDLYQEGCVKFLSEGLCGILNLLIPEGIPSPAFE